MSFYITKQYQRGSEIQDGSFESIDAAKQAIQEKLNYDTQLKINTTYRLYDILDELLGVFDINSLETSSSDSSSSSSSDSSSTGKGSTFNPTPFNTAPRPAGIPHNWVKENDTEDKEKNQ